MDYQSLYLKTVVDLRKMAKDANVRIPSGANKAVIINLLLEAFRHNTTDGKSEKNRQAPSEKTVEKPVRTDVEAAAEIAAVKVPEPVEAKEAGSRENASNAVEDADQKKPAPMRMAANPQVIDRRMPVRPHSEKANASTERAQSGAKPRVGNVPRPRSVQAQDGEGQSSAAQSPVRANRTETPAPRCEKRVEGIQGRYPARQENSQNRMNPRYESQNVQPRSFARQDVNDGRPGDAENQNRYENRPDPSPEMRNRGYRQENIDNRMSAWQDGRIAVRRDGYYDETAADGGVNRSPNCYRNGDYGNRDGAYPSSDVQDYGQRPVQIGAEYPVGGRMDGSRNRREGYYSEEYRTSNPAVPEMLASGECTEGSGVLEIQSDGYGFLRAENYQQGSRDVYISIAQIRRFNLRVGDYVVGQTRPQREGDRYTAMMYITEVNGQPPEKMIGRKRFDELIPVYPDERLRLEQHDEKDLSLRIIDMLAPIGKGQRGLIVSQPKAGKTTLLKKLANAITSAHPEIHLIVLLIDERPEEVTDMKRSINGEVVYSTFDEAPENHTRVSDMVLERAQRLVEMGRDVVILMDSITRLARAYNLVIPPTGRSLSGGLDPGALHKPKRFFGAARNIENGGSLTIIATALVDTGSRMDDIIYEEFKGTGNMELHLDRKLSDRRVFPAVDMVRSGTRREELLLSEAELEGAYRVRRMLPAGNEQGDTEKIIALMEKTESNAEFFQRLSAYKSVYERSGFSMSKDSTNGR